MICFYDFISLIICDPSAAQEKLAVWLVVMVGIASAVEFLACFCAFWDLHVYFLFWGKGGGSTC